MSSKFAFGGLIMLVMCVAFCPRPALCTEWKTSPFRAQLASADPVTSPAEQTASADSSTSVMANPLKKNIGKAALFSLIIPGTGELYSGSWLRAVPFFAVEVAGWAVFAANQSKGNSKTSDFEKFAGWRDSPHNFDARAYMYAEYKVAIDTIVNNQTPYHGDFADYWNFPWEERSSHLPAPFTHDVFTTDEQQFYEMIGKYFDQFGWGWQDTYNSGHGYGTTYPDITGVPDWTQPISGNPNDADKTNTVAFDGASPMFYHYRDMRGLANSYYNKGNVAIEVVLVNHILSALDAAFAVRTANKRLESTATPTMGHLNLHYNAREVNGSLARYVTATIPLN